MILNQLSLNIFMSNGKLIIALLIAILLFTCPSSVRAFEKPTFITIVNPVRGRPMWSELSLLKKQAQSVHDKNLVATWLVQYNVLEDEDVVKLLKSYNGDELGIF